MVRACVQADGDELWPASVMLSGEYGVDGVSLSVPVRLGGGGARRIEEWELSPAELGALDSAAAFVREAAEELDL
jgi:malate dehydrogenase